MDNQRDLKVRFTELAAEAKNIGDRRQPRPAAYFYGRAFAFETARNDLHDVPTDDDTLERLALSWGELAMAVRLDAFERREKMPSHEYAYYSGVADGLENAVREAFALLGPPAQSGTDGAGL
jgi:hypothetical protein